VTSSPSAVPSPARLMLRLSLLFSAISVASAAVASAVVIVFFTIGHLGARAVVAGQPELSLPGAFVVYIGQLIALVAVFLVLRRADWMDGPAFGAVAIVATLVWQVGQILGFRRARHEIYPDVTLPRQGP
jgi:ATP synthase protein I